MVLSFDRAAAISLVSATHIHDVQNMSNASDHDEPFFEEIAALLMPWGWSRPVGRMFAYLLVQDAPVTLDQLAADLAISKSNASVAARTLEVFGNARRHAEPGSKRISYSAPDMQTGPFASRVEMLAKLARLVDARTPGRSAAVATRLENMADFFARMGAAMHNVIDEGSGTGRHGRPRPEFVRKRREPLRPDDRDGKRSERL